MVADTAGRVLELLLLLEQLWTHADAGLTVYPLVFLSNVAESVLESAQKMVGSAMSPSLSRPCSSCPPRGFPANVDGWSLTITAGIQPRKQRHLLPC